MRSLAQLVQSWRHSGGRGRNLQGRQAEFRLTQLGAHAIRQRPCSLFWEIVLAHHKSALKRIRQNDRRRQRNQHVKSTARGRVRKVREAAAAGNPKDAQEALTTAVGKLNRAASKGVIPKKRASRLVSRLTKLVNRS